MHFYTPLHAPCTGASSLQSICKREREREREYVCGVILPDRSTAPIYAEYNDLLFHGTPEDVERGMHNHHWANYHASLLDEQLQHTMEDGPAVPRRLFRGSTVRALEEQCVTDVLMYVDVS
jgi:hypothetical protein